MRALVWEHLHYEIAMSIGNSLDLSVMLKESLSTYLRKLNCLGGAVLQAREENGYVSFEPVYAIPKRIRKGTVLAQVIDQVPPRLNIETFNEYMATLPLEGAVREYRYYVSELPGFGLLLLVRSTPGFSPADLKSLTPINIKLAGACRSCRVNEQLQAEIIERKRAETLYREMVENAVDGIYHASLDGPYLRVNPAMATIFGYDSTDDLMDAIKDIPTNLYVHGEKRQEFLDGLLEHGMVLGWEFEFRRKDGSTGWLSTSARLRRDEDGNPLFIEGVCKDITHQKEVEAVLREAKAEAERLSQVKSNLIAMVSHELRTPLTSILGFAKILRKRLFEVLDDGDYPEKLSRFLSRLDDNTAIIVTEGERLTELVSNVLDLAKLEAGEYEWDIKPMDVGEMLKHSMAATEVLFEDSPVKLVADISSDLPQTVSDHDRLVQVTINLLSNAAKFTVEGEVRVTARQEEDRIVVRVADSGIGVPAEEADTVFMTFRQLGNTLTDKPKGTGLGLPICKEVIERLGGTIWHEPNPQGGSVFVYAIPVVDH